MFHTNPIRNVSNENNTNTIYSDTPGLSINTKIIKVDYF